MKTEEKWVRVESWSNYMVSNFGNVCFNNFINSRPKAVIKGVDGYMRVTFWDKPAKRVQTFAVHRLVAMYFVEGDKTLDVAHKDGDKENNHYTNLKWVTRKENEGHKKDHKTFWAGNRVPILNKPCVTAIKNLRSMGWSQQKIASVFEIAQQTVANALKPGYADALIKELNK